MWIKISEIRKYQKIEILASETLANKQNLTYKVTKKTKTENLRVTRPEVVLIAYFSKNWIFYNRSLFKHAKFIFKADGQGRNASKD